MDISTAGYGAFRKIMKPREKSWKLWDEMYNDYFYGWQEMSKIALGTDLFSAGSTGWSMYQINSGEQ